MATKISGSTSPGHSGEISGVISGKPARPFHPRKKLPANRQSSSAQTPRRTHTRRQQQRHGRTLTDPSHRPSASLRFDPRDPSESATLNRDPIKPTKQVLNPTADSCPFFCLMKVVESTASYISLTSRLTIDPSRHQPSADKNNHQPRR